MSDFGAPATFLRLRTKIWKLTYENLYMELMQDYVRGSDRILPHKYASMHQVSINATPWLNVGIFESTMYSIRRPFRRGIPYPRYFLQHRSKGAGR